MQKTLTIRYNSFNYSRALKKFMNTLLKPMHKSPLKTLHLITTTFLDIKKPILCELARQLPISASYKYHLKRLWRFFSKSKFTLLDAYAGIIPYFLDWLKSRKYLEIIIDWTKVADYWVLCFSLPYSKRAIPLLWRVVDFREDEEWQNLVVRECLGLFFGLVPQSLRFKVVVVADRGFGGAEFFRFLNELGVNYVIRVKGDVWVRCNSFSGSLRDISLAKDKVVWWQDVLYRKDGSVCVNLLAKYDATDPWYLVTNLGEVCDVVEIYGHRMRIEEGFRDFKHRDCFSLRVLGLRGVVKVEKMILVMAVAYMFVLLFGAACRKIRGLFQLVSTPEHKIRGKLLSDFRIGLALLKRLPSSFYECSNLFNFKKVCPKDA